MWRENVDAIAIIRCKYSFKCFDVERKTMNKGTNGWVNEWTKHSTFRNTRKEIIKI